jgi:signal peptidase I
VRRSAQLASLLSIAEIACGGGPEPSAVPTPAPAPFEASAPAEGRPWVDSLPVSTRVVGRLEGGVLSWLWSLRDLRTVTESAARCRVDLARDVRRIGFALADPGEASIDVEGDLTLDDARCMFAPDASAKGAVRWGHLVILDRAGGGGVRLVTPGLLGPGAGLEPALAKRWTAASLQSGSALVARLSDPSSDQVNGRWLVASWGNEAIATISLDPAHARAASSTANDLIAGLAEKGALPAGFEAHADSGELALEWKTPLDASLARAIHDHALTLSWVEDSAMLPTLLSGEIIALVPRVGPPRRGEVTSYTVDGRSSTYIGRVIGLEGERVRMKERELSIDGAYAPSVLVDPTYASPDFDTRTPEPPAELWRETVGEHTHEVVRSPVGFGALSSDVYDVRVPKGHVLVLGDHRDNTLDSRRLGPVPIARLGWKAAFVVMSISPRESIRWERMLLPID